MPRMLVRVQVCMQLVVVVRVRCLLLSVLHLPRWLPGGVLACTMFCIVHLVLASHGKLQVLCFQAAIACVQAKLLLPAKLAGDQLFPHLGLEHVHRCLPTHTQYFWYLHPWWRVP